MNNRIENKLTMLLAVRQVIDDHSSVWNGTPAFVAAVNELKAKIENLEQVIVVQQKRIEGVTEDKQNLRIALVDVTLKIAKAAYVYAVEAGNNTLRENVKVTRSSLERVRDTQTFENCQLVYNSTNALVAELANYGIEQADLDSLEAALTAYEGMISAPRNAIVDRKQATQEIDQITAQIDHLLNHRIDQLMELFSSNDFNVKYHGSRKLIDSGRQTTRLKGVVVDKATKKALDGVEVSLQALFTADGIELVATETGLVSKEGIEGIENDIPEPVKFNTGIEGAFEFKNLKEGEYIVTISKVGYVSATIEKPDIRRGKTFNLGSVELVRLKNKPPTLPGALS